MFFVEEVLPSLAFESHKGNLELNHKEFRKCTRYRMYLDFGILQ